MFGRGTVTESFIGAVTSRTVRYRYRAVGLLALVVAVAAGGAAQFEEPSHPLSQINPVDVALNMADQPVRNVSAVEFANPSGNGYVISNYRISSQSGVSSIKFAPPEGPGTGQFQLESADLNVSDNSILEVQNITEFFNNECGENQAVKDIYPNGTFVCGQAGGGLPTVLSINNTATRDINLSEQDLEKVDEVNPGGRNLQVGGDVISGDGSYTSTSSEVCIGDQCDT